tara:strand:- start:483 stop:1514 length:1032 start_codon:yes stop_codon:yes gene_type:complete
MGTLLPSIDWLDVTFPTLHEPFGKDLILMSPDGEIERSTRVAQWEKGSFEGKLGIVNYGSTGRLMGNPIKFLTGQNVIGVSDPFLLIEASLRALYAKLELPLTLDIERAIRERNFQCNKVDFCREYRLRDETLVRHIIKKYKTTTTMSYRGRPTSSGDTVYWGKNSQRSALKLYGKRQELRAHPPSCPHDLLSEIFAYSEGLIRFEARWFGRELERYGLKDMRTWDDQTGTELFSMLHEKVICPHKQDDFTIDDLSDIPNPFRATARAWAMGVDVRPPEMARNTFYRHRRALLEFDIDIANPFENLPDRYSKVITLKQVHELRTEQPTREMKEKVLDLIRSNL